jgi:hypothetical protein
MAQTFIPAPDFVIPAFTRDQFMLGDCVHLAHALAVLNPGWGVLVVGEAEEQEFRLPDGTVETYWDTGTIQHGWAVRPDGALVDIEGVHPRTTAETLAAARGFAIHEHATAEEADHVWCPSGMDLAGDEDPDEVAAWVMERWGTAAVGTLCAVNEADTDPDEWLGDDDWDEHYLDD